MGSLTKRGVVSTVGLMSIFLCLVRVSLSGLWLWGVAERLALGSWFSLLLYLQELMFMLRALWVWVWVGLCCWGWWWAGKSWGERLMVRSLLECDCRGRMCLSASCCCSCAIRSCCLPSCCLSSLCFIISSFSSALCSCFRLCRISPKFQTNRLISPSIEFIVALSFSLSSASTAPISLMLLFQFSPLLPSLAAFWFSQQHSSSSSLTVSTLPFSLRMDSILLTKAQTCSSSSRVMLKLELMKLGGTSPLLTILVVVLAVFLMRLALELYFSVLRVYSQNLLSDETQAIMTVFALPPRESLRMRVSLESRKGMKAGFLCWASMLMHLPRVSRLLLMLTPQTKRLFWLRPAFSLPARSIMKSFDSWSRYQSVCWCWVQRLRVSWRTACEREEVWLLVVQFMARFYMPYPINYSARQTLSTASSRRSLITTPLPGTSRMARGSALSESRSRIFSLQISQKESATWNFPCATTSCSNSRRRVSPTRPVPPPSSEGALNMVQVLPAPVMPQMKTVELYPCRALAMGAVMVCSNTSMLLALGPNTCSYRNSRSVSLLGNGGTISTSRAPSMRTASAACGVWRRGLTRRQVLRSCSSAGGEWRSSWACI